MSNTPAPEKENADEVQSKPVGNTTYIPYNAGIDGIRAIAVLAVIAYHSGISRFSGGFLGVEIFFVISGYLITALLLAEYATNNRIDIKRFWNRRARRLFPALIAYIGGATALAYLTARDVVPTKSEIFAAFGYVYNWFSIFQDVSYTEGFERKNFFHHLWSLAVEEQFYLIWPLLLWGLLTLVGKRITFAFIIAGIIGSTILRWVLYEPFTDPLRVYYGTDTRASALLIGAALAFLWRPWESDRQGIKNPKTITKLSALVVGGVCLGGLIWANMHYTLFYPRIDNLFRGGMLITSVLTALVIAVSVTPKSILGKALGIQPMRWIGKRSYGLYLWHWPVFQLTRPRVDVEIDGWELFLIRMAVTLLLVEVSYQIVERPIRERRFRASLNFTISKRSIQMALGRGILVVAALIGSFITLEKVQADWNNEAALEEESEPSGSDISNQALAPTPEPTPTVTPTPTPTPTPEPLPEEIATVTPEAESPMERFDILDFIETVNIDDPYWAQLLELVVAPEFPVFYDRITFLGDSIMKGALTNASIKDLDTIFSERISALTDNVTVEAEVARQWNEARGFIRQFQSQGQLGQAVVIHLGSNGVIDENLIARTFELLEDVEIVLLVNARVPKPWESRVNESIEAAAALYENAVLVDWRSASNDYPEYFARDGVHVRKEGAKVYLDQIILGLGGEIEIEEEELTETEEKSS